MMTGVSITTQVTKLLQYSCAIAARAISILLDWILLSKGSPKEIGFARDVFRVDGGDTLTRASERLFNGKFRFQTLLKEDLVY